MPQLSCYLMVEIPIPSSSAGASMASTRMDMDDGAENGPPTVSRTLLKFSQLSKIST